MGDEDKKKEELISELTELRHQISALKTFEHTHKSAESALLESQRTLTTPMGNLPGMAYRCRNDCDWTMEYVSDGCVALTGYRPVELIENSRDSYAQLIHPGDQEYVWNEIQTALKERRPFTLVYRITMADGRQKWVWEQGCGIFSHDGELLCLEGFITDITDLRQSEEHARKQKFNFLVIEDEEDVRKLHEDILIDAGHEVCTATGGGQGVELFKRGDFDLVIHKPFKVEEVLQLVQEGLPFK
jgi:PAS domain S-box-containing protein